MRALGKHTPQTYIHTHILAEKVICNNCAWNNTFWSTGHYKVADFSKSLCKAYKRLWF